ncbi:hypothetical protein BO71DRAFT_254778 [Aspergillus ellipticus CBS 707.79]|uniref:Uncharacterized protein n=1 Tax=Aspergillus ellipticus CBS 707.79 TaxID=1448320 RepID=A0A319D869_9EURO|nr:hypothetical protein BO71DRAFT_254778 [Aspergillus ellipticus CBS 707.79]
MTVSWFQRFRGLPWHSPVFCVTSFGWRLYCVASGEREKGVWLLDKGIRRKVNGLVWFIVVYYTSLLGNYQASWPGRKGIIVSSIYLSTLAKQAIKSEFTEQIHNTGVQGIDERKPPNPTKTR